LEFHDLFECGVFGYTEFILSLFYEYVMAQRVFGEYVMAQSFPNMVGEMLLKASLYNLFMSLNPATPTRA
jgi:hypothetical protein